VYFSVLGFDSLWSDLHDGVEDHPCVGRCQSFKVARP
jgi:hypothetical protein